MPATSLYTRSRNGSFRLSSTSWKSPRRGVPSHTRDWATTLARAGESGKRLSTLCLTRYAPLHPPAEWVRDNAPAAHSDHADGIVRQRHGALGGSAIRAEDPELDVRPING